MSVMFLATRCFSPADDVLNAPQKVNDSGTDDGSPPPVRETSIQEPGASGRTARPEAPVDSMLKDLATIIFSTFLLAGWVAFMITYPKVRQAAHLHFRTMSPR